MNKFVIIVSLFLLSANVALKTQIEGVATTNHDEAVNSRVNVVGGNEFIAVPPVNKTYLPKKSLAKKSIFSDKDKNIFSGNIYDNSDLSLVAPKKSKKTPKRLSDGGIVVNGDYSGNGVTLKGNEMNGAKAYIDKDGNVSIR